MEQHPRDKVHQNVVLPQGRSCPFPRLSMGDANRESMNFVQNAPVCLTYSQPPVKISLIRKERASKGQV